MWCSGGCWWGGLRWMGGVERKQVLEIAKNNNNNKPLFFESYINVYHICWWLMVTLHFLFIKSLQRAFEYKYFSLKFLKHYSNDVIIWCYSESHVRCYSEWENGWKTRKALCWYDMVLDAISMKLMNLVRPRKF